MTTRAPLDRIESWALVQDGIVESATFIEDGKRYAIFRSVNGIFHAQPLSLTEGFYYTNNYDLGYLYQPPAAGTKLADVNGATHPHDDGTHWHICAISPSQQHVLEAEVEALLISHFQSRINSLNMDVHSAPDVTARTLRLNKLRYLQQVADDAQMNVETAIRKLWLGQHIQEQKHDFARETAVAAIRKAVNALTELAKTDPLVRFNLANVKKETNKIISELRTTPTYKTRIQASSTE